MAGRRGTGRRHAFGTPWARGLGSLPPAGSVTDRAARAISGASRDVQLTAQASPLLLAETFRSAGITTPTVTVPAGSHVTITLINADDDMAHGLVITTPGAVSSVMPILIAAPAFGGAALWFLGEPPAAGAPAPEAWEATTAAGGRAAWKGGR